MKFIKTATTKQFIAAWLGGLAIISPVAAIQLWRQAEQLEINLLQSKWIFLAGLFGLLFAAAVWLLFSRSLTASFADWLDIFYARLPASGIIYAAGIVLIVLPGAFIWVARLYLFGGFLPQLAPIFCAFLIAAFVQSLGAKALYKSAPFYSLFASLVLIQGVGYQIYGAFLLVSSDPFSIGYSEAGRHYYASLFFSKSLYGLDLPLPFLHPSRYLLLSIPFIYNGLGLWSHRLWQALLWIALTGLSAWALARRAGRVDVWLVFWIFLYYLQGAVYYHLQVCVFLVLIGVEIKKPWLSFVFIALASLWAGISRVNWFPVPAMLAIALYLLQKPFSRSWKYWVMPFGWGLGGTLFAFAAQFVYIAISRPVSPQAFGSSFTSDLLWNRLLPNATFPMGILPGIALVSLPVFWLIFQAGRHTLKSVHVLRWAALGAMLFMLFIGGLVVSVKIGGGGDLHNMDAFLVMLSLVAVVLLNGQAVADDHQRIVISKINWNLAFSALLIPLMFALPKIDFYHTYDSSMRSKDLAALQAALKGSDEILFITERQLLTFGYVDVENPAYDYEQSELMEMAMSGNRPYLEQYYADLKNRRFKYIVAEGQKFTPQKKGAFVEENIAWVRFVGAPLLCNYKPALSLSTNNIQVFEPRPGNADCKDPFLE